MRDGNLPSLPADDPQESALTLAALELQTAKTPGQRQSALVRIHEFNRQQRRTDRTEAWEGSPPRLLPFNTEKEAVEHVESFLRPVCSTVVLEPVLKSGLRPDIGFRLTAAPSVPLVFECKKFEPGKVSPLIDAIRQAHSYTHDTGHIAVVGPIEAQGPTHLAWYSSAIGAIGLVAGEFSVGYLYLDPRGGGGICIGGQALARFRPLAYGSYETTMHSNAPALLRRKSFAGSTTWRAAS